MAKGQKEEYRFFAGPLKNKTVRQVSDKNLQWAVDYNLRYIEDHSNPMAVVKFGGRRVTTATVPSDVIEQRIYLAKEAIEKCREEQQRRVDERMVEARRSIESMPSPKELVNLARVAAVQVSVRKISSEVREMHSHFYALMDSMQKIIDCCESLAAAMPPVDDETLPR